MPKPVDLSKIEGFDWDEANVSHIAKHNVTQKEAEQIFFDTSHKVTFDPKHSKDEKRYVIYGKTNTSRQLTVVFTDRKAKVRIISARDMSRKERRIYGEEA